MKLALAIIVLACAGCESRHNNKYAREARRGWALDAQLKQIEQARQAELELPAKLEREQAQAERHEIERLQRQKLLRELRAEASEKMKPFRITE